MKKLLRTLAIAAFLLTSASAAQAQVSVGIQIGRPPAPRGYQVPHQPGNDYDWIEGYWYPQGSHYRWHNGYWTRPPYAGAYWVAPYYISGRYYAGRWEGRRGNYDHNHSWDKGKQRDEGRDNRPDDGNDGHR